MKKQTPQTTVKNLVGEFPTSRLRGEFPMTGFRGLTCMGAKGSRDMAIWALSLQSEETWTRSAACNRLPLGIILNCLLRMPDTFPSLLLFHPLRLHIYQYMYYSLPNWLELICLIFYGLVAVYTYQSDVIMEVFPMVPTFHQFEIVNHWQKFKSKFRLLSLAWLIFEYVRRDVSLERSLRENHSGERKSILE